MLKLLRGVIGRKLVEQRGETITRFGPAVLDELRRGSYNPTKKSDCLDLLSSTALLRIEADIALIVEGNISGIKLCPPTQAVMPCILQSRLGTSAIYC